MKETKNAETKEVVSQRRRDRARRRSFSGVAFPRGLVWPESSSKSRGKRQQLTAHRSLTNTWGVCTLHKTRGCRLSVNLSFVSRLNGKPRGGEKRLMIRGGKPGLGSMNTQQILPRWKCLLSRLCHLKELVAVRRMRTCL
uniref:Uncharacterized protein n=1 Tax=Toxoplasma gondii COUG TaxID=1074873 RepID=A0A2G8Y2V5_TOXGO|nr:hypothetical protein TGCOUG_392950 [Toxoplasma gondii COUG]